MGALCLLSFAANLKRLKKNPTFREKIHYRNLMIPDGHRKVQEGIKNKEKG